MSLVSFSWRWTADPRPVLMLDAIVTTPGGYRLHSIPAWQLDAGRPA